MKSGYYVANRMKEAAVQCGPSRQHIFREVDLMRIWRLPRPKKMKNLIRRWYWNTMIVGVCSNRRGLTVNSFCPFCSEFEDMIHLLFGYQFTICIWFVVGLKWNDEEIKEEGFIG